MAKRWQLSVKDWWSGARHAVTFVAGEAAVAGLQAFPVAEIFKVPVVQAAVGAGVAALVRVIQQWVSDTPEKPTT